MSALQYLDLFDRILKHKLAELAKKSHDRKKVANTLLCKEFVTYKGIRRSGLLNFIGWLISNNGKIYLNFLFLRSIILTSHKIFRAGDTICRKVSY